ncbi:hypothetical protein B0H13DRAFT_2300949 [Mycena leptocephala]|nr:hypothetical protein B0H13DRAFT_2300949 [Mycena leptocephala]
MPYWLDELVIQHIPSPQLRAANNINTAIKSDLHWFLNHLRESAGILLFEAVDWNRFTEADVTIFCEASLHLGMGFWMPELLLGFYSPTPLEPPAETIFFFEAFALCATPNYNPLLRTTVDNNLDLRVLHIKGKENYIADAVSRQQFADAIPPPPPFSIFFPFSVAHNIAILPKYQKQIPRKPVNTRN